jgi:methylthioribose-1-phosphate isomerase
MTVQDVTHVHNVSLRADGEAVVILDQTLLPNTVAYLELRTPEELYRAIARLQVRGAPAIGICAAYGIYVLARGIQGMDYPSFLSRFRELAVYLNSARPTAVNLSWALSRMEALVVAHKDTPPQAILPLLEAESRAIHQEDRAMCLAIARHGLTLLKDGDGLLTHCNAGPLATSQYGTALGPILLGQEQGLRFKVYADETRPLLQGARLTCYELHNAGVDVTLLCDNMAATVMGNGWIAACLVGCDRVAANGDAANKIGTRGVAILARYYGIPFYVLGPSSTIDPRCATGADIPVELRDPSEISAKFYAEPMAPAGVPCYNPAFDVTDHSLITAIVTEQGVCYPPFAESLKAVYTKN